MAGLLGTAPLFLGALVSTSSTVQLDLGDCVPARDLVHDLVAIEIGFDHLVDGGGALMVHVACDEQGLHMSLDPNVHHVEARRLSRRDIALDGARLIALNIVELIQEGLTQQRAPPPPAPEAKPEPSSEPAVLAVRAPEPSRALRARLSAAGTLRYLSQPGRLAGGGRAALGLDVPAADRVALSIGFDAGFEQADADLELGSLLRTRALSLAILVGARIELGEDFSFFPLAGVRGGWVWLSGQGDEQLFETGASGGVWLGPLVAMRLRYGGHFGISAGIEGGWTARSVVGDALEERVGLAKGWVGADLALDWSFGE